MTTLFTDVSGDGIWLQYDWYEFKTSPWMGQRYGIEQLIDFKILKRGERETTSRGYLQGAGFGILGALAAGPLGMALGGLFGYERGRHTAMVRVALRFEDGRCFHGNVSRDGLKRILEDHAHRLQELEQDG
ncbi:hypothetical protein Mmc1_2233 [Magnetococcus marinus MC-1]|uniref:Uncharacterized protein n=1 Tax=Magnetococcus marinus (strain ATCC BAA-1437 / JCM 17883 / MC-1) TaxID=156889 RepID=A0L9U1_MAGMM|nr:hypothetical protein [Magnetococcus marinus]ABK44734.1 hypothetical protein Mmc1_2233 [Magnetococcus marinus MC-1]